MDGTAAASRTSPRARRLTCACRVCALVSLLLIMPPFHGVATAVLLVGPLVLAPAGYELSLLLTCVSAFFAVASWMTRRSGGDSAKGPAADGKLTARWLASGITIIALLMSIAVSGFECLLAAPYIAEPTGPAGDRVVVVERNVLLAGYGDVYLIPGGFGVGRKIAGYSADDGYSPWATGPTRSSGAGQSRTSPHTAPPPIRL